MTLDMKELEKLEKLLKSDAKIKIKKDKSSNFEKIAKKLAAENKDVSDDV